MKLDNDTGTPTPADRRQEMITRTRLQVRAALRCFDFNYEFREMVNQAEITCVAIALQAADRLCGDWSKGIEVYIMEVSPPRRDSHDYDR